MRAIDKSCVRRRAKLAGCFAFIINLVVAARLPAAGITIGPPVSIPDDLSAYRTPDRAETMRINSLRNLETGRMGFLGIMAVSNAGQIQVTGVAPDSPALKTGVAVGDVVFRFNGVRVNSPETLRGMIESNAPGESVELTVRRGDAELDLPVTLAPLGEIGRPMERVRLGVVAGSGLLNGGVPVEDVDANSTGAEAGLKKGDAIVRVDGQRVSETNRLGDMLAAVPLDRNVMLTVVRGGDEMMLSAKLAPPYGADRPVSSYALRTAYNRRGYNTRARRDVLRVAVIGLEFPDVRHNPAVTAADWENAFFSTGTYRHESATGQPVHGSVNDFYLEQSSGAMGITGKMFGWLEMSRPRAEYSSSGAATREGGDNIRRFSGDSALVTEAVDKLVARDGTGVLTNYDGYFFLYAGDLATQDDGDALWPHTQYTYYGYSPFRYSVSYAGADRMADISLMCHELGHILGLPDLYVEPPRIVAAYPAANGGSTRGGAAPYQPANPYAATLATWDLMSIQVGFGRPQHMSAWSKEQLGWIKPAVINPRVQQDIILSPIENSTNQCLKIPLAPDGNEYLLLENRERIGFDESLPGQGLLIWRVVYGRPVLEEAHGYTGANAAMISPTRVPYPTERNNSFTPYTTPSSAAYTGDEVPVYISNIRRLPDRRIALTIGPGYM